jgi:hypothetical protein
MLAVNLNTWYWFCIQVEYQRLRGKNGAIELNLCEEATDGRLAMQQVGGDRWLTGDVASVHAIIAKNRELQSQLEYRMLHKDV